MYRQGDVLVVPVKGIPARAKPVGRDRGRIILAHGEATGHAHAIVSDEAELLAAGEGRYLRVRGAGATLSHEEHRAIPLPPGEYRVVIQREYRPEGERRVLD
jgi:hypothetical protein